MKYFYLKYFLYLCIAGNFIMGNPNETFSQPKAHESSLHDKITSREPRAFILKDMRKQRGICVEINGVFYESMTHASRVIGCQNATIKRRCLSNKFPNYKIVPFRITYTKKKCITCGKVKLLKKFNKNSSSKDGFNAKCKKCAKTYYQNNKGRSKECSREWHKNNPDYQKIYYQDNKEEIKKQSKEYRSCPDTKNRINKRVKEKRKTDAAFKLNGSVSSAIRGSLKGKKNGRHCEAILGYTIKEFIAHLESKFTEGMTWKNYGCGKYEWSLDHIIAIYWWNITSIKCQELKDCWALDNLQPLWHIRNIEKGIKPMEPKYLIKPF